MAVKNLKYNEIIYPRHKPVSKTYVLVLLHAVIVAIGLFMIANCT
jgi:hypothetical protein